MTGTATLENSALQAKGFLHLKHHDISNQIYPVHDCISKIQEMYIGQKHPEHTHNFSSFVSKSQS